MGSRFVGALEVSGMLAREAGARNVADSAKLQMDEENNALQKEIHVEVMSSLAREREALIRAAELWRAEMKEMMTQVEDRETRLLLELQKQQREVALMREEMRREMEAMKVERERMGIQERVAKEVKNTDELQRQMEKLRESLWTEKKVKEFIPSKQAMAASGWLMDDDLTTSDGCKMRVFHSNSSKSNASPLAAEKVVKNVESNSATERTMTSKTMQNTNIKNDADGKANTHRCWQQRVEKTLNMMALALLLLGI